MLVNNKVKGYPKIRHSAAIIPKFESIRKEIQGVWNVIELKNGYALSLRRDSSVNFEVENLVDLVFCLEKYMGHRWMIDHKLMEVEK